MSEIDEVRATCAAYLQAIKTGDAEKGATLFTEDAVQMPPNAPLVRGRDAICRGIMENGPIPSINEEFLMIDTSGDLAFQRSRVTWDSDGSTKYTVSMDVLKRCDDGVWRYIAMVWNSSEGFDQQ
jgi:ketosteroid isomerase-like protein